MAQVLVQNRVSLALPVIPDLVQREGINVRKMSPSTMMIVNLVSPGRPLSRHLPEQLRDHRNPRRAGPPARRGRHHLPRPARLQHARLARPRQDGLARHQPPTDVITAISQQNLQVAAGQIGQQPVPAGTAVPAHHQHAGPARRPRAVRRHHPQGRPAGTPRRARARTPTTRPASRPPAASTAQADQYRPSARRGRGRAGSTAVRPVMPPSTANRPSPCRSTSCPAPTPSTPRTASTPRWRS